MRKFLRLFRQFKNLPKGMHTENPDESIFVCNINCIALQATKLYVSKRSLKHIAEKADDFLIGAVLEVCKDPDELRRDSVTDRYLLAKTFVEKGGRPGVVCIEIMDKTKCMLVTVFTSKKKYLSNFELLWRTGVS